MVCALGTWTVASKSKHVERALCTREKADIKAGAWQRYWAYFTKSWYVCRWCDVPHYQMHRTLKAFRCPLCIFPTASAMSIVIPMKAWSCLSKTFLCLRECLQRSCNWKLYKTSEASSWCFCSIAQCSRHPWLKKLGVLFFGKDYWVLLASSTWSQSHHMKPWRHATSCWGGVQDSVLRI
jgi:hypothetical protein